MFDIIRSLSRSNAGPHSHRQVGKKLAGAIHCGIPVFLADDPVHRLARKATPAIVPSSWLSVRRGIRLSESKRLAGTRRSHRCSAADPRRCERSFGHRRPARRPATRSGTTRGPCGRCHCASSADRSRARGRVVRVKPNRWVLVIEVSFLGARMEAEVDERLVEKVI